MLNVIILDINNNNSLHEMLNKSIKNIFIYFQNIISMMKYNVKKLQVILRLNR